MLILSFKPGHDGAIAALKDGELIFSLESEKDSFPRYYAVTPSLLLSAASLVDDIPDVVAISGWVKGAITKPLEAGYFGHDTTQSRRRTQSFFGRDLRMFSSTHERSHLLGAYGMSPFPQGQPCYALVWEGNIGSFYYIDEQVRVHSFGEVLEEPGNKYSYLFAAADPSFPDVVGKTRFEDAGKLMALAAYGDRSAPTQEEAEIIEFILSRKAILHTVSKAAVKHTSLYNCGVESQTFKSLAAKFSDALFQRFYDSIRVHVRERVPLLISGGCGLNCEWNTRWLDCGLFSDVFVPPCTNDSGSAVGTAVDAQFSYTGSAKIRWSVYAGTEFVVDCDPAVHGLESSRLDYDDVAAQLADGAVLGWVQGRYEMGPRALGNRSILSSPMDPAMLNRLNVLKQRESYRPIAPVCLEEDLVLHTGRTHPSPFMLHFYQVQNDHIPAVTHVDGSARFQTVNEQQNPALYRLLKAFKARTGIGVLCNTSLNFKGRGFINRMSDLVDYGKSTGLDSLVVNDRVYARPVYSERTLSQVAARETPPPSAVQHQQAGISG